MSRTGPGHYQGFWDEMGHAQQHTIDGDYVETPQGIFTAGGSWFRTTETSLKTYAGEVLTYVPLRRLLAEAERWLRTPETLAIWSAPFFLALFGPASAAALVVVFYLLWKSVAPGVVLRWMLPVVELLEKPWVQALFYTAALTVLAWREEYAAVWVGIAIFVLLRWGLLSRAAAPLTEAVWKRLYDLPGPDQVLRALVVKVAMKHQLSLPELDRMRRDIWNKMR